MNDSATHPYLATHPYWVGYLAATIVGYLNGSQERSDLQRALREFLRSPCPSPELQRLLTKS